jgi:hypothetical protein
LGGAFLGHVVFIMTILVGVCKFNDWSHELASYS